MRKYIYLACGGFLGAVLRLYIKDSSIFLYNEIFPLDTLVINIVGSFLIALFLSICIAVVGIDPDIRLGVTTGLIGAFTTFSTVCKETVSLIQNGYHFFAIQYLFISIILGVIAVYTGVVISKEITKRLINSDKLTCDKDEIRNK